MIRESGRFLFGFFISSDTVFRLIQPSYAQSVAKVANAVILMKLEKSKLVPSGKIARSGETSPISNAEIMMIAIGISFATMVKFWNIEPAFMPSMLYAVNAIISAEATSFPVVPVRPNIAENASAPAASEPAPLKSQLLNPFKKPTSG